MEKITFQELAKTFREHNDAIADGKMVLPTMLAGVIVYKASNWPDADYSEKSRSYVVTSNDKKFQKGMISSSYYGCCLDGTDFGVRLDAYNWEVDYCYLLSRSEYETIAHKLLAQC